MFEPFNVHDDGGIQVEEAFKILQKCGGSIAIKVIKTWLNGWVTSRRMHEDPMLGCLLGCRQGEDCLAHYLVCPHMYALQNFLFKDVSSNP